MKQHHLVVGAGLAGCVAANELAKNGHYVTVIDKRKYIGGLCADTIDPETGVPYHRSGPHLLHTDSYYVIEYLRHFTDFNEYKNFVMINTKYGLLHFPINLISLSNVFGRSLNDAEAKKILNESVVSVNEPMANAEAYLYSTIGKELTDIFFRAYSEKQWSMPLNEIPASTVMRIPSPRLNIDCNYFTDKYQFLPHNGYSKMFRNMLNHKNIVDVMLNTEYSRDMENKYTKIWYSGPIDQFFNYKYGSLQYNAVTWKYKRNPGYSQIVPVINYGVHDDENTTRTTEYNILLRQNLENKNKNVLIASEHPLGPHTYDKTHDEFVELAYPILNQRNEELYKRYEELSRVNKRVVFIGRLGKYKYFNMDKVILDTLDTVNKNDDSTIDNQLSKTEFI